MTNPKVKVKRPTLREAVDLLEWLADTDECYFDHHGGCQQHGALSLEPGERCPNARALELITAYKRGSR